MFIVMLKFSANKSRAGEFMASHNAWIKQGFDDDVFLLAGSLEPGLGGSVIAHKTTLSELENRVNDDPFVAENVVTAEIIEISPKKVDQRLGFLVSE